MGQSEMEQLQIHCAKQNMPDMKYIPYALFIYNSIKENSNL